MPITSSGENYERPERLDWLFEVFDKHFDRRDEAFASLNQKATWTLATATGLAAASGFVKGSQVGALVNALFSNYRASLEPVQLAALFFAGLFVVCYLTLVHYVIRVYRPQPFEYPVSPVNVYLGEIKGRHDDGGEFGTLCWDDVMDRYVLPEDIDCYYKVLRGYVDTHIEAILTMDKMSENLSRAFWLLYPITISSIILLLFV